MSNLSVPRPQTLRSHSSSTGESSTTPQINVFPQFLSTSNRHRSSKSASSLLRITRTNTSNNTEYPNTILSEDTQHSERSIDAVPSSRPSVTYLDKLWTQIDVLDDVKNMSNQVKLRGSFFNDSFNEELNQLKASQNKLLEVLALQHTKLKEEEQVYKLTQQNNSTLGKTTNDSSDLLQTEEEGETRGEESNNESTQMAEFFGHDGNNSKNILYRKQDLKELDRFIEDMRDKLNTVGEAMKNFDETTRDLW